MRKPAAENDRHISETKLAELKSAAYKELSECRRAMLNRQPFTGSVAMNLNIVPIRDTHVDTACTDGKNVFFDLAFMEELTREERIFVFAHEVWHNLMCHFARNENRDRRIMNIATDLEVNQILVKDGFTIPQNALMPEKFGLPPDKAAEEYYEMLVKSQRTGNSDSFDKHMYGDDATRVHESGSAPVKDKYGVVETDPDFKPDNPKDNVSKIREAAVSAAQVCERTRGELPAHIKGLVNSLLKPEIDWRESLQQFVTRCMGDRREWNPPNRRHIWQGSYLQSRRGEKIRLLVGLDVSGSTQNDIPKFLGELNGLVKTFSRYELDVLQADTQVNVAKTYSDDEPLDLENEKYEIVGMGGTTLKPIFDWASENDRVPTAAVIFTDGGCEHFSESDDPGYPVMWMVAKGGAKRFAEFGDIVEFKAAS